MVMVIGDSPLRYVSDHNFLKPWTAYCNYFYRKRACWGCSWTCCACLVNLSRMSEASCSPPDCAGWTGKLNLLASGDLTSYSTRLAWRSPAPVSGEASVTGSTGPAGEGTAWWPSGEFGASIPVDLLDML